jgi:MFS family permease
MTCRVVTIICSNAARFLLLRLSGPTWAGWAGLITASCGTVGFVSLGFLADAIGRKPTAMIWYAACLVLTPIVYLWGASWGFLPLLVLVGVFGFFTLGIWAWAPVWLPELFPTRMRGTAVAFCFNAPRFVSCLGPLIAGTLIAYFGGFGMAATIVGLFFILGVVAAPFLPETKGKPLPHALWQEARTPPAEAAS